MLRPAFLALPFLLAACGGPAQAPEGHDNMVDGRGAHAGSFREPGSGNVSGAADVNTEAAHAQ